MHNGRPGENRRLVQLRVAVAFSLELVNVHAPMCHAKVLLLNKTTATQRLGTCTVACIKRLWRHALLISLQQTFDTQITLLNCQLSFSHR